VTKKTFDFPGRSAAVVWPFDGQAHFENLANWSSPAKQRYNAATAPMTRRFPKTHPNIRKLVPTPGIEPGTY